MKFAVIVFPGSNCDLDMYHAIKDELGEEVEYVWHDEKDLSEFDGILLPGGFSYGDYLRCGAMAKQSNVMSEVVKAAEAGKPVLGICNGFQVLTEAGLLPGALLRNKNLKFMCRTVELKVVNNETHLLLDMKKMKYYKFQLPMVKEIIIVTKKHYKFKRKQPNRFQICLRRSKRKHRGHCRYYQ